MSNVEQEFDTMKDFLTMIMEKNVATRDSDTLLYVEACRYLGAKTLDDVSALNLNIISIHKTRQIIQNRDGLYPASEKVKEARGRRQISVRDYMRKLKHKQGE